jgi:hypothetical protein
MYGINVLTTRKVINFFTVCIDGNYKIVLLINAKRNATIQNTINNKLLVLKQVRKCTNVLTFLARSSDVEQCEWRQ